MKNRSFSEKTNAFLRSCLFSLLMILVTVPFSFFCLGAQFFSRRYSLAVALAWMALIIGMLKTICHIDYKITGLENIPADRVGVVLSKHQSMWETFLLPLFFYNAAIIAKREILWIPFMGWAFTAIAPIIINRSEKASALEQIMQKGQACLAAGRWIIVYPEGTRIPYGKVGNYRSGGARVAVAAGCPVLPVAHNAGRFWPKRRFIKYPGTIEVVIGKPIETIGRQASDVTHEAKDWIEATILQLR